MPVAEPRDPKLARREPRWMGPPSPTRMALIQPISAARWLLVLVLIAGIYFFHGFVVPVLAALVIAFASWPLFVRLRARLGGSKTIAASVAILLILSFLIVPVAIAISYAARELHTWFDWAYQTNQAGAPTPDWLLNIPRIGDWLNEQWIRYIGHPGAIGELIQLASGANIGNISRALLAAGGGAFNLFLTLLFMLIALFFVYRDGEAFAAQLDKLGERLLPTRWDRLSGVVPATISSTVTGMTLIAIGEGVLLGFCYWLAGVPSPVTLGVLTGIMALIPGGAPLSFTLVSIYLVASGSVFAGIALFIWGSVELFIVDKTLRPRLVGGPIKLPFLPTFFGLVGGVKTMGFLGLFIGPVLMALLVAIWREWLREAEMVEVREQALQESLDEKPLAAPAQSIEPGQP